MSCNVDNDKSDVISDDVGITKSDVISVTVGTVIDSTAEIEKRQMTIAIVSE